MEKQSNTLSEPLQGPFKIKAQQKLARQVMAMLGFDFEHGRLDISHHPFCGGVPKDVRITTRYSELDFLEGLMGIVHETGHACYEQNLPEQWQTQPVGQSHSMGLHESQSLFYEMQLSRHPEFIRQLLPELESRFGSSDELTADNLVALSHRVKPGLIRVDADEISYPAHIMLRFEIERDLIEGAIKVRDLPEIWDSKMQHYLGLSTLGNDKDGCMQDIHWCDGSFGYFPSYTLGAMYAAQLRFAMEKQLGSLDSLLTGREFEVIFNWLKDAIWQKGRLYPVPDLILQVTGSELSPDYFLKHLKQRYL